MKKYIKQCDFVSHNFFLCSKNADTEITLLFHKDNQKQKQNLHFSLIKNKQTKQIFERKRDRETERQRDRETEKQIQ